MTKEASRTLNFLAALPSGNSTLTKDDLHGMLLETGGTMLACGRLYNIVSKNLGAGVYRIHLELTNP